MAQSNPTINLRAKAWRLWRLAVVLLWVEGLKRRHGVTLTLTWLR